MIPYSKTHSTIRFMGLTMEITPEFISRVTTVPLGPPYSKEEKPLGQVANKTFFQPNEYVVEDKNGIRRTSIPYPWDEFSYQIIKYISMKEGTS